jgi:hypothetical protein
MNINATIIVQAFNFFIVYWMVRIFLFKPIIAIIDHENAEEQGLLDIISQQQKSLEIQEKERQRHWYICQEYFNTHQPYRPVDFFFAPEKIEEISTITHELSPDDVAQITADVRNRLEETIKHVH